MKTESSEKDVIREMGIVVICMLALAGAGLYGWQGYQEHSEKTAQLKVINDRANQTANFKHSAAIDRARSALVSIKADAAEHEPRSIGLDLITLQYALPGLKGLPGDHPASSAVNDVIWSAEHFINDTAKSPLYTGESGKTTELQKIAVQADAALMLFK